MQTTTGARDVHAAWLPERGTTPWWSRVPDTLNGAGSVGRDVEDVCRSKGFGCPGWRPLANAETAGFHPGPSACAPCTESCCVAGLAAYRRPAYIAKVRSRRFEPFPLNMLCVSTTSSRREFHMLVGHVGQVKADFIGGWAADTEAPNSVVDVIVYIDGKRANHLSCDHFRQDLLDLGKYGEGRHGFQWRISPPLPVDLLDRISVRFSRTGAVLPGGEIMRLPKQGDLSPILITAPGRSGTTLMMGRLALSPLICIAESHPFEVRLMAYWSTTVRILAGGPDYERSTHPDKLEGDGFRVGSNPYSHDNFKGAFLEPSLGKGYFSKYISW